MTLVCVWLLLEAGRKVVISRPLLLGSEYKIAKICLRRDALKARICIKGPFIPRDIMKNGG